MATLGILGRKRSANRVSTVAGPRFPRDSHAAKCRGADGHCDDRWALKETTSRSNRVAVVVPQ